MVTMPTVPFATQLQNEIEYGEKGMFRKHLAKDPKRQAMLICLRAGIQIPEHTSSYDGFLTVIQGRGVFWLAGQEVSLEPGMFIDLPANTRHALTVTEDLALLKVVDSHEFQESSTESSLATTQESACRDVPKQTTCAEAIAAMLQPYLHHSAHHSANHSANHSATVKASLESTLAAMITDPLQHRANHDHEPDLFQ